MCLPSSSRCCFATLNPNEPHLPLWKSRHRGDKWLAAGLCFHSFTNKDWTALLEFRIHSNEDITSTETFNPDSDQSVRVSQPSHPKPTTPIRSVSHNSIPQLVYEYLLHNCVQFYARLSQLRTLQGNRGGERSQVAGNYRVLITAFGDDNYLHLV